MRNPQIRRLVKHCAVVALMMTAATSPVAADEVKVGFSTIGLSNTYNVVLSDLVRWAGSSRVIVCCRRSTASSIRSSRRMIH